LKAIVQLNQLAALECNVGFFLSRANTNLGRTTQGHYRVDAEKGADRSARLSPLGNRSRVFVTTDDIDLLKQSAESLHSVVDAVLRQTNRTKPLSVIISMTLPEALCEPHFFARHSMSQFPANNRLESLRL
jgi:hypothetical protein